MRNTLRTWLTSRLRDWAFVRDVRGQVLLENFFISAVAAVLVLRLILHFTDYPSLSGRGLHIAHMLPGGLLMLVAMFLLLGFVSRASRELAAVLGGFGFGMFIDELGKFITADNDYFFRPTAALIYVIFILVYFAIRGLQRLTANYAPDNLANAFEIAKQGAVGRLHQDDLQRALALLDRCDPADPVVRGLRSTLLHMKTATERRSNIVIRLRRFVGRTYGWLAARWWFTGAVVAFFVLKSLVDLYQTVGFLQASWGVILGSAGGASVLIVLLWSLRAGQLRLQMLLTAVLVVLSIMVTWALVVYLRGAEAPWVRWAGLVSSSISAMLVVWAVLLALRSRLEAYKMFERAVLVSILLTQVFAFYENQFVAVAGLVVDILALVSLRYVIDQEQGEDQLAQPDEVDLVASSAR